MSFHPEACGCGDLPAARIVPELAAALRRAGRAVLSAPPGAGKTTVIPPALLDRLYPAGGRIVMLEPRRVAARAAAARIAALLGETVGGTVGYRVRGDARCGALTRIEVVTEGMLTRMIQLDPELSGVSLLIFDEFHERSLQGDLGLALALEARAALREDLHLLVMSATLETERVAALLDDAPVVCAAGRMFPVAEHWGEPFDERRRPAERMASAIRRVLEREAGSLLAFLPGAREIEETAAALADLASESLRIVRIYGALDRREQDEAIAPPPPGCRKVVLATNIAESSLTIEGVRVVVDSGYERAVRFDPGSGMSRLETVRISRASAIQRAGRAGRLEPGAVYRLWSEADQARLPERRRPEILDADLAGLRLELAQWGTPAGELRWIDPPPAAALAAAETLLIELGALDAAGRLTGRGRELVRLPVHPRIGAMLLRAGEWNLTATGCELAALLEERDALPRADSASLAERLEAWRRRPRDFRALNTVRDQLRRLTGVAGDDAGGTDDAVLGRLTAAAYPDWIAHSRGVPGVHYRLSCGRGARLRERDWLCREVFLAVARLDGAGADAAIQLAAPLSEQDIRQWFADRIRREDLVRFDRERQRVVGIREVRLGELVLQSVPLETPPPERVLPELARAVRETGGLAPFLDPAARSLGERLAFAHRLAPEAWPAGGPEAWPVETLLERVPSARSFDDLRRVNWRDVLTGWLGYDALVRLDREYPERFTAPTGSRLRIDYSAETPVLAVRVQELFGVTVHPSLGGGRMPLRLELLSPAQRPIQVTSDLPGFWKCNWSLVRKEMRARYPKHLWPEDPAAAAPTTRAKPRKESENRAGKNR